MNIQTDYICIFLKLSKCQLKAEKRRKNYNIVFYTSSVNYTLPLLSSNGSVVVKKLS